MIFEAELQAEVSRLRQESDHALLGFQDDEILKSLVSDEAGRRYEVDAFLSRVEELEDDIAKQKGTVIATSHRASDARHLAGTTRYLPFRGYCSTPLPIARRDGCPCVTARPDDDEVQQTTRNIVAAVGPEKDRLARLEEQLEAFQTDLKISEAACQIAQRATAARRAELNATFAELSAPRNQAADLEAAYRAYLAAEENLTTLAVQLDQLSATKATLDKTIEAHARGHREGVEKFGDLYNAIVQAMLGREVTGRIELAGDKTLQPKLEFHGSFDSAALGLTKLLAFDLAALALSQFNGTGHHPRFLLHDSPRESDLAAPIYRSLFLAAQAMEEACGENIGFQYIVTTTEPPPAEVNQKPWLLDPVLDATVAEQRFLGVDL